MPLRNRSQKIEMLQNIPMFSYLTKKQLGEVARHTTEVDMDAGHVLARDGEIGHELFIIVDGTATVSRNGKTLAQLGRGDCVGEMSLLDRKPRSADVVADEPMSVLVIGEREFKPLLESAPDLSLRLLRSLAQRLRDADNALTH
jgi:CRP/FNR family transcriptional regulator, cyclic AMP receptor protein